MSTRKLKKVAEALRREIGTAILYKVKDPRIRFVTVTRAEPSLDLRTAKVYVAIRGDEDIKKKTLAILKKARGYIQSLVGEHLSLRYVPILSFCLDESIDRGQRIEKLIEEVTKEEEDT
ncbi:MAG TPA: 30S ribosome-binding factor RbfA [Candidatus Hypogeohydataceae bacterium YC41]